VYLIFIRYSAELEQEQVNEMRVVATETLNRLASLDRLSSHASGESSVPLKCGGTSSDSLAEPYTPRTPNTRFRMIVESSEAVKHIQKEAAERLPVHLNRVIGGYKLRFAGIDRTSPCWPPHADM
jgi:hypothetical protein